MATVTKFGTLDQHLSVLEIDRIWVGRNATPLTLKMQKKAYISEMVRDAA